MLKIKFDKERILSSLGIECTNEVDYINYLLQLMDNLYFNNKNYTKKQYFEIEEVREILLNMEVLENGNN